MFLRPKLCFSPFAVLFCLSATPALCEPQIISFNNTQSFGPDGPWQAITIAVGEPQQYCNVYPGGVWAETIVLTADICNGSSACLGLKTGFYDRNRSRTANDAVKYVPTMNGGFGANYAIGANGTATIVLEQLRIPVKSTGDLVMTNGSIEVATSATYLLPDGSVHPMQVGTLSLGAPDPYQKFEGVIANMVPGFLQNNSKINAMSYGLHIGSAALGIEGSLVFGGYDKARVLGDVAIYDSQVGGLAMITTLLDVGLGVELGGSPFPFDYMGGLLKPSTSTSQSQGANTGIPVQMNPNVPYMFLPKETCDGIASQLPVTFAPDTGLYYWNTNDAAFQRLISSPAYLRFDFATTGSSQRLTIKVPFKLLNLTIEPPLVSVAKPYFPCRPFKPPSADATHTYHLGRAFLQAAFVGMRWNDRKWWLAQAPGPKNLLPSVTSLDLNVASLTSFPASQFAAGWTDVWTPLPSTTQQSSLTPPSTSRGLSGGAKAGIAVGVVLSIVVGACLAYYVRRRNQKPKPPPKNGDPTFLDPEAEKQYRHRPFLPSTPQLLSDDRNHRSEKPAQLASASSPRFYELDGGFHRRAAPTEGQPI